MDALMGFAAGVMVAASCWSLLVPTLRLGGVWLAVMGQAEFAVDAVLAAHVRVRQEAGERTFTRGSRHGATGTE